VEFLRMKNLVVEQEQKKPEFLPIHVSFTIESEEELKVLWNRFNYSEITVEIDSKNTPYHCNAKYDRTQYLWSKLNELAKQTCGKDS
jgi:hypothetical protein